MAWEFGSKSLCNGQVASILSDKVSSLTTKAKVPANKMGEG
jgi:hypothetical protein